MLRTLGRRASENGMGRQTSMRGDTDHGGSTRVSPAPRPKRRDISPHRPAQDRFQHVVAHGPQPPSPPDVTKPPAVRPTTRKARPAHHRPRPHGGSCAGLLVHRATSANAKGHKRRHRCNLTSRGFDLSGWRQYSSRPQQLCPRRSGPSNACAFS